MQFAGRRWVGVLFLASMLSSIAAPAARAGVNVNRESSENPMREVAMSIVWGGLAGFLVGGSIALATDGTENDDEYVRWGIVTGTFVGLGMGLWFVSRRPPANALLEFQGGDLRAHLVAPQPAPGGELRLPVVAVRF